MTCCLTSLQYIHPLLFFPIRKGRRDSCPPERFPMEKRGCTVPEQCAVATGASQPSLLQPERHTGPLSGPNKAAERGEGLVAPGKSPPSPRLFSLLQHPLIGIPQLSATFLRTSKPWKPRAHAEERENKRAKNKEPGSW